MTFKIRSRSPKLNQLLRLSQRYIQANLVEFHHLHVVHDISRVQEFVTLILLYLQNKVKVTKTESALKFVKMIYPGKFDGIPSTSSRDIVGTRICHANDDMDADSNGIRTQTNMSPPPQLWWGDIMIRNKSHTPPSKSEGKEGHT